MVSEIIPMDGGSFNTLYRINGSGELKNGVILKTGPRETVEVTKHEKDILQTEVYAYQMMEGKKIPIPKVYAYDFSKEVLPCDYFLMERMEGDTWYQHFPIRDPGLMRALGKYTARMHSVKKDWFGSITDDKVGRYDTWGAAFNAMIEQVIKEIKGQGLSLPYEKIQYAVSSRRQMLDD